MIKQQFDIRYLVVATSLLISLLMRILPSSLNDDSYLYIRTAEIFLDQGAQAAFSHYSWAGYSVLIAWLSQIGLSLINAAFIINALCFALLAFAFVSIVQVIDSNRRTLFYAALTILIFPELNEYRSMIIRDVAFWAFAFLSLWQLLLYIRQNELVNGIGFCGALLLAAVFRVEALIYLVAAPLALMVLPSSSRQSYLKLLMVNLFAVGACFIILLPMGINLISLVFDFISVYSPFIETALNVDPTESDAIAKAIFGDYAADYSDDFLWLFIATGLLSLLLVKVTGSIGLPVLALLIVGVWKKCIKIDKSIFIPMLAYVLINFVIVFGFIYLTRFLPSRHSMLLSLVVLLVIPLIIASLLERAKAPRHYIVQGMLCFLTVYCVVDSYYSFGHSKNYIPVSIQWLGENSSQDQGLITNNHAIAFSSGKIKDYDQVPRNLTADQIYGGRKNDLVAVEMNLAMTSLMDELQQAQVLEFLTGFPSNEEPRISVYRVVGF